MKILIVTQRYWPENFRITDIAETLVSMGHKVTVLTGLPNYPQGYLYDGYKKGENRIQNHNGVDIVRAKEIERRHDIVHRFLNYYSFPHYAKKIAKKLDNDFDVVLFNELSPIMSGDPAIKYAQKNGAKVLMYEMDLWPESLLAGGIKPNSFIYKHYAKVSGKIYSKCDYILTSTKEHIDYIKKLPNCANLEIEFLPQYAENLFDDIKSKNPANGQINVLFAGNIGKAQDIPTIIKAAELLKDDSSFMFHFVGDGSELENAKKMVESLSLNNVVFYGSKPVTDMPEFYSKADAMLVTLEDKPYARMTIPGKIQSYIAAGKPVIGALSGSGKDFIINNELGYAVESGDYENLAKIIHDLKSVDLVAMGNKAKNYYQTNCTKDVFMDKLLEKLNMLSKKND